MRSGKFELYDDVWQVIAYNETDNITTHLKFNEIDNPSNDKDIKLVVSKDAFKSLCAWEYVRERYGKPIRLSCSYREADWNKKCGGVSNSLHITAQAYDCQVGNISDSDYVNWLKWVECACEKYGMQGELGRYAWGLHIGFATKLPYSYKGIVYQFDKR